MHHEAKHPRHGYLVPRARCRSGGRGIPDEADTVIVPFPPDVVTDVTAGLTTQKMQGDSSQQFVVDNRPGANGSISAGQLARAEPDGYRCRKRRIIRREDKPRGEQAAVYRDLNQCRLSGRATRLVTG